MAKSYYDILGVSKKADEKEIRQAFRRLARKHHPDLNPGNKKAEAKFKETNEAYEVLSDAENRKKYDRYGDNWKRADQIEAQYGAGAGEPFTWSSRGGRQQRTAGFDPFAGLEDLLGRHGRTATTTRIEGQVDVTLEEAFAGSKRNVTITSEGKDRRLEVTIPPGVDTGSAVRVSPGEGHELLLRVTVLPHKRFQRKGDDLSVEAPVPMEDAILGGEIEVQTLKGKVHLKVPAESQNGQRIRLAGQGMPRLGSKDTSGDLYVVLRPRMPRNLTAEERDLVGKLKEARSGKG